MITIIIIRKQPIIVNRNNKQIGMGAPASEALRAAPPSSSRASCRCDKLLVI